MAAAAAVLAALGESSCAALAGTLQHTAASRSRSPSAGPTGELGRFVRSQLGQRVWWLALGVQAAALVLHATALRQGSLVLVQPVLAAVVVLALPLNHWLGRTRISRRELGWAALLTAGLAAFLVIAAPSATAAPIRGRHLIIPAAIALLAVLACVLVARRWPGAVAAVALGSAAGIAFSLEAALLQTTTDHLLTDPVTVLTTPSLYAVVIAGVTGVTLTQLAYRAGSIAAALPAITTVNPLVSIVIGVVVGDDTLRTSGAALIGEVVTFGAMVVAVVALARITEVVLNDADARRRRMLLRRRG